MMWKINFVTAGMICKRNNYKAKEIYHCEKQRVELLINDERITFKLRAVAWKQRGELS